MAWKHKWEFHRYGVVSIETVCFIGGQRVHEDDLPFMNGDYTLSFEDQLALIEEYNEMNTETAQNVNDVTFKDLETPEDLKVSHIGTDLVTQGAIDLLVDAKLNASFADVHKLNAGKKVTKADAERIIEELAKLGGNERVNPEAWTEGRTIKLDADTIKALDAAINSAAYRLTSDCHFLYQLVSRQLGDDFDLVRYMSPEDMPGMVATAANYHDHVMSFVNAGEAWSDPSGGDRKVVSNRVWEMISGESPTSDAQARGGDQDPLADRIVANAALVKALASHGFNVRDTRASMCTRVHENALNKKRTQKVLAQEEAQQAQDRRKALGANIDVGF